MGIKSMSASIYNNVVSGAGGVNINNRFVMEQIEDDVIRERYGLIKEYFMKNLIPIRDLVMSINCLPVDCASIEKCCIEDSSKIKHFEIPQIINDFGASAVDFLGSVDRQIKFAVYTDYAWRNHKYRRRGADSPYVWIDTTPNNNNMYDVFVFNAPFITTASITAVFKDPRQLEGFSCCPVDAVEEISNFSFIEKDIIQRVTEKYLRYYRQMAQANTPNTQEVK